MRRPKIDRRSAATVAVALLPVLVAAVRGLLSHRAPLGDNGLIALRAHDVLTVDHPWFGTWTSASLSAGVDFNNPSPLHFDALAVFVKPFGVAVGSVLGAAAINASAIALAIRQGWHLAGRRGEALAASACVMLSFTLGSEMLADPWQPHNLVLPFLAFMVTTAALATGHWSSAPWAVAVGSMVLGAHLSFVYLVLALLAVSAVLAWRVKTPGWRRGALWSLVAGLLAWLQPLLEQFLGYGRGNLSRLLEASSGGQQPIGLRLGARLVSQVVAMPPWWLRPSFTDSVPDTAYSPDGMLRPPGVVSAGWAAASLVVLVGLLTWLSLLWTRRHDRAPRAVAVIALTGLVVSLGTAAVMPAGVIGLAPHQVRWLWPVAAMVTLAIVDGVDRLVLHARVPRRWRMAAPIALMTVAAVGNLPAHLSDLGPSDSRSVNDTVRSLMRQVSVTGLPGATYFDGSNLVFAEPYSGPVLAALVENGQPIRAGDVSFARQLGEHRRRRNDEQWVLQVRAGTDAGVVAAGETVLASATAPNGDLVTVVVTEVAVSGG